MATDDQFDKLKNPGTLAKSQLDSVGAGYSDKEKDLTNDLNRELKLSNLLQSVKSTVDHARYNRSKSESQWFDNTQAFKGIDTSKFRQSEENSVYLRTTSVKTRAAFAQIVEALLSDSRFPIQVTSTEVPEGVSEYAHIGTEGTDMAEPIEGMMTEAPSEPQGPIGGMGFKGDGFEIDPKASSTQISKGQGFLGGLKEVLGKFGDTSVLKEGPAKQGETQIDVAKTLAFNMDKLIQDQLTATKADSVLRQSVFECCMLGTGAIKGPFNVKRTLPSWSIDEESGKRVYTPKTVLQPHISFVSIWNLYIDPNANCMEDAEWVAEKHRYTVKQLLDLKSRPHFDAQAIDDLCARGGNYTEDSFEVQIRGNVTGTETQNLFEVFEYWGYVPTKMAKEHGLEVPPEAGDIIQVNMWYSDNSILRLVLNPFLPQRLPYFVFPYERKPYEIYGIGIPEMMEDSQKMMNGFSRLAVDNLSLAGNVMMAIDDSALIQGQTDDVYPGKIWRILSGTNAQQAIQSISFPNTAPENLQMMREFRQQADESTGIPSIAHGQTGVSGFGRTAYGMSTLLQNASMSSKTVIRNIDDNCLKPLAEALYQWNMQFSAEEFPEIAGDLEVKATGSQALQLKEVRAQRLQTFLQISANPAIAPLIKIPTIVKELAVALEMDPEEILNSPEEQQLYAALMGTQNMQPASQAQAGSPGLQSPMDPGFTGNDMSAGNPEGLGGSTSPEQSM